VDDIENVMCFLHLILPQSSSTDVKGFQFTTNIPDALKVHDSIYDYVAFNSVKGLREEAEFFVAFRPELFGVQANESDYTIEKYFHQEVMSLLAYENAVFDTFFWTSLKSQTFFDSADQDGDADFVADRARQHIWTDRKIRFAEYSHLNDQGIDDVCEFRKILHGMILHPVSHCVSLLLLFAVHVNHFFHLIIGYVISSFHYYIFINGTYYGFNLCGLSDC